MILLLSPAKSLDFKPHPALRSPTLPRQAQSSLELLEIMRGKTVPELARLQHVSDKLAELNHERWLAWDWPYPQGAAKEAILAFHGDVYQGMSNQTLEGETLAWAQDHVRILSGFYGLLRPLDQILPYRLEMGTPLPNSAGKDLYAFWQNSITALLNQDLLEGGHSAVINLASQEYSASVQRSQISVPWIDLHFKDEKNGKLRVMGLYAKRARGMMARFILDSRLTQPEELLSFNGGGYTYCKELSTARDWVFTRPQP